MEGGGNWSSESSCRPTTPLPWADSGQMWGSGRLVNTERRHSYCYKDWGLYCTVGETSQGPCRDPFPRSGWPSDVSFTYSINKCCLCPFYLREFNSPKGMKLRGSFHLGALHEKQCSKRPTRPGKRFSNPSEVIGRSSRRVISKRHSQIPSWERHIFWHLLAEG